MEVYLYSQEERTQLIRLGVATTEKLRAPDIVASPSIMPISAIMLVMSQFSPVSAMMAGCYSRVVSA